MSKLTNKVALITGGSKGIGLAIAKLFAQEGAKIIITGRNLEDLKKAQKEIVGEVFCFQSDTANLQDIKALFNEVGKKFEKIDTLFVNAGIAEVASIEEATEDAFNKQIDVNYKGAFFTVKESLPYLAEKSSITFTASVAAIMGIENLSIYSSNL